MAPYVSNTSRPVFALTGLPEVVKGALFARYSRSPKSLRRLLVDEFLPADGETPLGTTAEGPGAERAEALYGRVLAEYGDDSVAQLGGAHIAVEGASNLLTKVLQWGRLASYLEQSTRYIAFTDRPGGDYRYHRPADVLAHPELGPEYTRALDAAFDGYARLLPVLVAHVGAGVPDDPDTPAAARERAIRARALDLLRGPAAGRHHGERRHLRLGAGLRGDADPDGRASAARGARVRAGDAGRAAHRDPGLPDARRPAGPGRADRRVPGRGRPRRPPP